MRAVVCKYSIRSKVSNLFLASKRRMRPGAEPYLTIALELGQSPLEIHTRARTRAPASPPKLGWEPAGDSA